MDPALASPAPMDTEDLAHTDIVGSGGPADAAPAPPPVEPTMADVLPDASTFYDADEIEAEEIQKFNIDSWSERRKGEDRQYTPEFKVGGATW